MNRSLSRKFFIWVAALATAVVLIANAHLIYVAATSEPACMPHVRNGEPAPSPGRFSAATTSC
jgi:hypothetical protein